MKRFYTIDSVHRGGAVGFWNTIIKRFQYWDTPGNLYIKYTDALKEYRGAIQEVKYCDALRVRLRERIEEETTRYHILKERRFELKEEIEDNV